jgi:hypothetical protein
MIRHLKMFPALLLCLFLTGCSRPEAVWQPSPDALKPWLPPVQSKTSGNAFEKTFENGKFTIFPLYTYSAAALVVGIKKYSYGWEAQVAPYDLALAWEELSKPNYNKFVRFSQRDRWYYFNLKPGTPFDVGFVYRRSSNNHMIPHTPNILNALAGLEEGDVIGIRGYLVRLEGAWNGRTVFWKSSTSRNDTGDGSCELIYVTSLQKDDRLYK